MFGNENRQSALSEGKRNETTTRCLPSVSIRDMMRRNSGGLALHVQNCIITVQEPFRPHQPPQR